MLKDAIIDCFADSPDVELRWLEGTWKGKEGVKRYFNQGAGKYPPPEFLHQVMPIAGVIMVDPEGKRAKGRWYGLVFISVVVSQSVKPIMMVVTMKWTTLRKTTSGKSGSWLSRCILPIRLEKAGLARINLLLKMLQLITSSRTRINGQIMKLVILPVISSRCTLNIR